MNLFLERHTDQIQGMISCYDRVVFMGTLPDICYAGAITGFLNMNRIRIFDYSRWAEPYRDELRQHADRLAEENGLEIEFVQKKNFRKEERIREILSQHENHSGLVHIFSALEPCSSFRPWHNKGSGKTYLKPIQSKCIHYYFYFIDSDLGLCYLRVPTWAPFRLQFYFNGHNALASKLRRHGIDYTLVDNAFVEIEDYERAQHLADRLRMDSLHKRLTQYVQKYCPVVRHFPSGYHWSLMQVEYATDIVFKRQADLEPIYDGIARTAVIAVKADNIATFLGRKLHGHYQGELGNDFQTRIQGTRIKHSMGKASIKMYDKHGRVLRIETTVNDVSFFKHYRKVEHRDGTSEMKYAPMKKTIYSLPALRELLMAANRRYLEFISAIEDPHVETKNLDKISRPSREGERSYRGFNLFHGDDLTLFEIIARGEFNISGLTNKMIRKFLHHKNGSQISRMLKRLRTHGLIKKIGKTYKYYLTKLGRKVVMTSLKLRRIVILPALSTV
ncbi:MAG: MarR family transcriptional regulator [Planctomycetota bacterium]